MAQFTTPTSFEQSGDFFFGRYKIEVGLSVVRVNGAFVTMPYPWMGDLVGEPGVDYFLGGRTYDVTEETGQELAAAGYAVTGLTGGGGGTPASPVASLVLSATFLAVTADASGSTDADGSIVTYDFNWGDGQTNSGPSSSLQHTYAAAGTYTVTLTVTDNDGLTSTTSGQITVSEEVITPPPPPADPPGYGEGGYGEGGYGT